jgi:hypothetical protein
MVILALMMIVPVMPPQNMAEYGWLHTFVANGGLMLIRPTSQNIECGTASQSRIEADTFK